MAIANSLALDDEAAAQSNELQELLTANEALLCENELFESFLHRVNPMLLSSEDDPTAPTGRHKKQVASKRVLTAEQKHDLALQEVQEVRDTIEQTKTSSEKLLDGLRAQMEECELRIAEIKKEAYEFKRDIVVGAENFRTGKTAAEKVIRYMEDKQRTKGAAIEKLRLKNTTLKTQIGKIEQQLQLKEEMGEVLHVIDFDQLKIENQQYLEKIEERNSELLRLKLTTGNTVQTLNTLKRKLRNLTAELEWLKHEISQRNESISKVTDEISKVRASARELREVAAPKCESPSAQPGQPADGRLAVSPMSRSAHGRPNPCPRSLARAVRRSSSRRSTRSSSIASSSARRAARITCRRSSTTSLRRLSCTSSRRRSKTGSAKSRSPRCREDGAERAAASPALQEPRGAERRDTLSRRPGAALRAVGRRAVGLGSLGCRIVFTWLGLGSLASCGLLLYT
jgi:chromosome segregation ATPase